MFPRKNGRRKQLFPVLTVCGARAHRCDLIARLVLIVPFIHGHGQAEPGVAFWISLSLFVFVSVCVAFIWAVGLAINGPDHVPARLAGAARVCPSRGPGNLPSRPDPSLRFILLMLAVAAVMISCSVTCATVASPRFRTSARLYFCQFQCRVAVFRCCSCDSSVPITMYGPASCRRDLCLC